MNDSIADMLIRIKNAGLSDHKTVVFPYSKLKMNIAELLLREGYIDSVSKQGQKVNKTIEVGVSYQDNEPKIVNVGRVSKLSRRVYLGAKDIRPIRRGFGLLVLSTPKGLMTGKEARNSNTGGEALFKIW